MMQIIKKTLKMLCIPRLYQFFHNTVFVIFRVIREEAKLTILLLTNSKYASDDEVVLANLRTKAHILDKGLQTECWIPGRGGKVYTECVKLMTQLCDSPLKSDPSYRWAEKKVLEYEEIQKSKKIESANYIPIHSDTETRQLLYEIIKARRCTRSFLSRPVEAEVLKKLVSVVNWGPVSCNRQPIVLHITQKPEMIRKCLQFCAGSTGFGEVEPPCFIAVCTDMRFYQIIDRHVPLIDGTFGIQNLLLLAHTYGIEGTILNWMHATNREDRMLRKLLAIPKYQNIIFNIALGYPSKAAPPPGRKDVARTYILH